MASKKTLLKLVNKLKEKFSLGAHTNYVVPEMWNSFNYNGGEKKNVGKELISVNPYQFYLECIEKMIMPYAEAGNDYNQPASQTSPVSTKKEGYIGGDWITQSSIYAMQIRTSTAWDHDASGELELTNKDGFKDTGTFLKSIVLLPLLKEMGIGTIYLLPICKNSTKCAKGEMGSPYAVKNFVELDSTLKDPMLGDDFTIDDEFAAFVEASHIMGIRVVIDVPPRTSARDSDLIIDHPDWFYWITLEEEADYCAPEVIIEKAADGRIYMVNEDYLGYIYGSQDVRKHIKKFCLSPDKLDPEKWSKLRDRYLADPTQDLLALINQEFGITTGAAFPDMPGDAQPPWTDVTFLRLFLDHPVDSVKYLENPEEQAPYILYDVIVARDNKGNVRNAELWDVLADIIPSYQKRFGIDGARIDMGHALPSELEQLILQRARQIDPEFAFIAEVLQSIQSPMAKESGYNMIVGESWELEPEIGKGGFNEIIMGLPYLALPLFATPETPDTPRAAVRRHGKKFAKLLAVLNSFLPNGVPFISSGFEISEKQPMNLGLGAEEGGQFVLSQDDPMYGKLAFFDKCCLHWAQDGNRDIYDILAKISKIRETYIDTIINPTCFLPVSFEPFDNMGVGTSYIVRGKEGQPKENLLYVVVNTDFEVSRKLCIDLSAAREKSGNTSDEATILYSEYDSGTKKLDSQEILALDFEPGEVKIILL